MKKNIKRTLIFMQVALMMGFNLSTASVTADEAAYVSAPKHEAQEVYKLTFDYLGKDTMPITGFYCPFTNYQTECINGNAYPNLATEEYYQMIKDAGVNAVAVNPEYYMLYPEEVIRQMEVTKNVGMGYFVHDTQIKHAVSKENLKFLLDRYYTQDNILGAFVRDEPNYKELTTYHYEEAYEWYRELGQEYGEKYSGRSLCVNLYPNYANNYSGDGTPMSFEQYCRAYLELTKAPFLGSDYYCFLGVDSGTSRCGEYFNFLSIMNSVSDDYKIPFWCFFQTGGQWDQVGKPSVDPYPTEFEMLWNINTSLAYGCKGIEYFTVQQPTEYSYTDNENQPDFERIGLLGAAGNKTQWYYYTKKVNSQIAAVDEYLVNATNMGVMTKGYLNPFIPTEDVLSSFRELQSIDFSGPVPEQDGVFVGCFDYQGTTMLYVVNASVDDAETITLNFDNNYKYQCIQRTVSSEVTGSTVTLDMGAGEAVLVRLLP